MSFPFFEFRNDFFVSRCGYWAVRRISEPQLLEAKALMDYFDSVYFQSRIKSRNKMSRFFNSPDVRFDYVARKTQGKRVS